MSEKASSIINLSNEWYERVNAFNATAAPAIASAIDALGPLTPESVGALTIRERGELMSALLPLLSASYCEIWTRSLESDLSAGGYGSLDSAIADVGNVFGGPVAETVTRNLTAIKEIVTYADAHVTGVGHTDILYTVLWMLSEARERSLTSGATLHRL